MREAELVGGYVSLAVRLDALVPGAADVHGPRPAADGKVVPSALVRDAGLLAAALPSARLAPQREAFLRAQLLAVEWTARRLTGQRVPFPTELATTFDVVPGPGSTDDYRRIHRELDAVLPGRGALAERLREHRNRELVPPEDVRRAVHALSEALRARTRAVVALPDDEQVEYRVVTDAPWTALHQYLGGSRSRVTLNAGAGLRWSQLVHLVAHEAYPGHHTERCRKDAAPAGARSVEHRVVLTCSPQGTVAEAAADLGIDVVVGPRWGGFAAAVLDGLLPEIDGDLAERVHAATAALARVRQDAALLLHQHGVAPADVLAYLRRWALLDEERAARVLRFLRHPLWRAYPVTYVAGGELVRRWWAGDPRPARYTRLLDEPVTPAMLRAELTDGPFGPVATAVGRTR